MFIQVLGIDLGKSNFHLIGHDRAGNTVVRKKFSRKQLIVFLQQLPPTTIAFEACGGAHWLGRLCQQFGHQVKLIPPQYVKPYVKGNKNDFIDADAIAEAAPRPSMRFVAVKTEAAQLMSAVHRVRQGYIKERTACMSRIGALLLEFGVSLPRGHSVMKRLFQWLAEHAGKLPAPLITELAGLPCAL
jgi:transposase